MFESYSLLSCFYIIFYFTYIYLKPCTNKQDFLQCDYKNVSSLLICVDGSVEEGYGPGILFNLEYLPSRDKLESLTGLTELENLLLIDKYKYNDIWGEYITLCNIYISKN